MDSIDKTKLLLKNRKFGKFSYCDYVDKNAKLAILDEAVQKYWITDLQHEAIKKLLDSGLTKKDMESLGIS